ncbi:hypothetical protein SDC9_120607 [bioreactor metagenome]|uniref:Uncharacterized protein n=1 Tax=bioreactor metagenome TaxID=1076179 RepID=A0A645C7N7_9ZZZZ
MKPSQNSRLVSVLSRGFQARVIGKKRWYAVCADRAVTDIPTDRCRVANLRAADLIGGKRKRGHMFLNDFIVMDFVKRRPRTNCDISVWPHHNAL